MTSNTIKIKFVNTAKNIVKYEYTQAVAAEGGSVLRTTSHVYKQGLDALCLYAQSKGVEYAFTTPVERFLRAQGWVAPVAEAEPVEVEPVTEEYSQCHGTTRQGNRCTRTSADGGQYCHQHISYEMSDAYNAQAPDDESHVPQEVWTNITMPVAA